MAASALHSWLCIQSTTGASKPSTSHVVIHCWSTFASGHVVSARPNGSITFCISWSGNWASTGPQASLFISVLGVYGGEGSTDADEGSSRFLFIYGYTTVFGNRAGILCMTFFWATNQSSRILRSIYHAWTYTHLLASSIYVNMRICMCGTVTC